MLKTRTELLDKSKIHYYYTTLALHIKSNQIKSNQIKSSPIQIGDHCGLKVMHRINPLRRSFT
jgi:hypothetical protein